MGTGHQHHGREREKPTLDRSRPVPITETLFAGMEPLSSKEGANPQLSRTPPSITSSAPVILLDSS